MASADWRSTLRLSASGANESAVPSDQCRSAKPKTIAPRRLAAEAVHVMETYKITQLLVVDEHNVLVGALNVHDLFRAGVM